MYLRCIIVSYERNGETTVIQSVRVGIFCFFLDYDLGAT